MRWRNLLARLRRPVLVTASAAVMVGALFPMDRPARQVVREAPPTPTPIPAFKPKKVSIPSIGVDAAAVPVWTEQATGRMASPGTADDIGWWAGRKAGKGNLLLDGHHDWNGKTGVFYDLAKLKKGDEVIVTGDAERKTLTYRVVWVKNYDRNIDATDLLGNKTKEQMATLITCGGTFDTIARTHRERVVARAELVTS